MKRAAKAALLILAPCAAFALGILVGQAGTGKPAPTSSEPGIGRDLPGSQGDRARTLQTTNEQLRNELSGQESKIAALKDEIEEVQATWLPFLSPEEEQWRKAWEKQHGRDEAWEARRKRQEDLEKKILQRRDRALRAKGIAELGALLQSDDPDELYVGVYAFVSVQSVIPDTKRETFKSSFLAALNHEDRDVRLAALLCLPSAYDRNMAFDAAVLMLDHPDPSTRYFALNQMWSWKENYRDDRVAEALVRVGRDDAEHRGDALRLMAGMAREGYHFGEELDGLLLELSRDATSVAPVLRLWSSREKLSDQILHRYLEMLEEPWDEKNSDIFLHPPSSEEGRPIALQYYLRVLRESADDRSRRTALDRLLRLKDQSILPVLETLAHSEGADRIRQELTRAIEDLKRQGQETGGAGGGVTERHEEVQYR